MSNEVDEALTTKASSILDMLSTLTFSNQADVAYDAAEFDELRSELDDLINRIIVTIMIETKQARNTILTREAHYTVMCALEKQIGKLFNIAPEITFTGQSKTSMFQRICFAESVFIFELFDLRTDDLRIGIHPSDQQVEFIKRPDQFSFNLTRFDLISFQYTKIVKIYYSSYLLPYTSHCSLTRRVCISFNKNIDQWVDVDSVDDLLSQIFTSLDDSILQHEDTSKQISCDLQGYYIEMFNFICKGWVQQLERLLSDLTETKISMLSLSLVTYQDKKIFSVVLNSIRDNNALNKLLLDL